jgi:hypothetical protein
VTPLLKKAYVLVQFALPVTACTVSIYNCCVSDDGLLNQSDVRLVISHWIDENSLKISDADLDKLAETLFNAADVDNSGTVTFDKFMAHLEKQPAVLANLNIGYVMS